MVINGVVGSGWRTSVRSAADDRLKSMRRSISSSVPAKTARNRERSRRMRPVAGLAVPPADSRYRGFASREEESILRAMTKQSLGVLTVFVAVTTGALVAQQPVSPPAAGQTPPAGAAAGRGRGAPTSPPPITWNSPPLPEGPMLYETGLVRPIRITAPKGLNRPWSMAFLPDGRILVTERPGRLRIVRNGVLDPTL